MFERYTQILEMAMYDEIDDYINSLVVYNGQLTPFYEEMYINEHTIFDPVSRKWVMVYP